MTHVGNHDQFSLGKTCEHLLGSLRTEKIRQSPAKNKGRHILQCVQSWPQVYACLPARQTQGLGNTHIIIKHDTRSEEHTSELQSLMRISYAVFCLQKKNKNTKNRTQHQQTYANKTK